MNFNLTHWGPVCIYTGYPNLVITVPFDVLPIGIYQAECWQQIIHATSIFLWPLTHLPLVPRICVSELGKHWFRQWLVAWSAPSHYQNQCWFIVNWTLGNKLQWNQNQNTKVFIHENAFDCVVCEMAAILSRGNWVNGYLVSDQMIWFRMAGNIPQDH